jgi:hypothetical protein
MEQDTKINCTKDFSYRVTLSSDNVIQSWILMLKAIITQPFILLEADLLTIFNLEGSISEEIRFSIHQPSQQM